MLALTRRAGEEIVIGAGTPFETTIKVVWIDGERTRLGVTAPRNVTVFRKEVQEKVDAQKNS